jgi:hypothetical protein
VQARTYLDRAIALYDPAEQRPVPRGFLADARVVALSLRSVVLWLLGYPAAAVRDIERALEEARDLGHAGSLMIALNYAPWVNIECGNYAAAGAQADKLAVLAAEKEATIWKATAMWNRGVLRCGAT